MKKSIASMFVIIVVSLSVSISTFACTIFNAEKDGMVLVGNNEDHPDKNGKVWIDPASEGKYGKITFGFSDTFTQGGMNDQGLFYDCFAAGDLKASPFISGQILPSGIIPEKAPTLEELLVICKQYGTTSKKMLESCGTVEEAVGFYRKNYEGAFGYAKIMVVDKGGNSAIITWDWKKNELDVYRKNDHFQVTGVGSNYLLPKFWDGKYDVTEDCFKSFLENTSIDITSYSNIYNLNQGIVTVYYLHNFKESIQFKLTEELAKGKHSYDIKALFDMKELKERLYLGIPIVASVIILALILVYIIRRKRIRLKV